MLGGVKASTPAARSLLDPTCAPGAQPRRAAPRNGPSVSPRNDPKEGPRATAKIPEGHDPPTLKFRDQKTPITHPFPCSGSFARRCGYARIVSLPTLRQLPAHRAMACFAQHATSKPWSISLPESSISGCQHEIVSTHSKQRGTRIPDYRVSTVYRHFRSRCILQVRGFLPRFPGVNCRLRPHHTR